MAITYRTVIKKAIDGFNDIQSKLSSFTDLGISAVSVNGANVSNNMTSDSMVNAIGNMATIKKSDGTFISGKVNYYGKGSLNAANNTSISMNGRTITVSFSGDSDLSDGYYTAMTLTGTKTYDVPLATYTTSNGTASLTVAESEASISGKTNISAVVAAPQTGTTINTPYYYAFTVSSSGTGSVSSNAAGYVPGSTSLGTVTVSKSATTYYAPINAATYKKTAGSSSLTVKENSTSISGATNISGVMSADSSGNITTTKPTSGYFYAFDVSASGTDSFSVENSGYAKSGDNIGSSSLSKSGTYYASVNAATFTKSNGTASLTVAESSASISGKTNISAVVAAPQTETSINTPYYYAFDVSSSGTGSVSSNAAGYVPGSTKLADVTVSKSATTYYAPINAATFTPSNGNATLTVAESTASVSGKTNISASVANPSTDTTINTPYYYAFTVSSSGTGSVSSNAAGYVPGSTSLGTVTVSKSATTYYAPVTEATFTSSGSGAISAPAISKNTTAGSSKTNITSSLLGDRSTSEPTTTPYFIRLNTAEDSTGKTVGVSSNIAGYVPSSKSVGSGKVTLSSSNNQYFPVNAATFTPSNGTATLTVAESTASVSGKTNISAVAAAPQTGTTINTPYYYAFTVASSGTGSVSSNAAGYVPGSTKLADVTVSKAATTYYVPISAGTISTGSTNETSYTQNTTAVVPANGYLYIGEGYYPNTQISLSTLIPDDGNYTNAGTNKILKGYEAYDTNGTKLIGTIDSWSPSSTYYTTSNTGYGAITGYTYVNAATHYIKSGALSASAGSDQSFKPTISKVDIAAGTDSDGYNGHTSALGDIYASTGTATTTLPSTGYYIAVQSSSGSKTFTATAGASTSGWIPSTSTATDTAVCTINASDTTYIPITSGVGSVSVGDATVSPGGISKVDIGSGTDSDGYNGHTSALGDIYASTGTVTTTLPSSGYYLAVKSDAVTRSGAISADASITTAGYMSTSYNFSAATSAVKINESSNYYIPINRAGITNGFVTAAGYLPDDDTAVYQTVYNSTDDCVDILFA